MYSSSSYNGEICDTHPPTDVKIEMSEPASQVEPTLPEGIESKESTEINTLINNSSAAQEKSKDLSTAKPQAIELKIITKTLMPVAETFK